MDVWGRAKVPRIRYGAAASMPKRRSILRSLLGSASVAGLLAIVLAQSSCRKSDDSEPPSDAPVASTADPGPAGEEPNIAQNRSDVPYERFYVEVGDAPTRGAADAPVTIVAFYDFECAYCERGHRTMEQLEAEYGDKLRLAYKAFPLAFHSQALIAALTARSAQAQGKFWQFHDFLFDLDQIDFREMPAYARAVGLDIRALADDIDSLRYGSAVRRDQRQGLRVGVRGTPAYFINGRAISGAKPIEDLRTIIDEELELAATWTAKGIAKDQIYAYAIADGYRRVTYSEKRGLSAEALYRVPLGDSPVRGDRQAPVTVVTFTDFECPYCARGHQTLERIREHYGDKIRVVFKHLPLPFHSHAFMAARAALAAREEGKFWQFHDAIFERSSLNEAVILAIAKELHLDVQRIGAAMESDEFDGMITGDMNLAHQLGVRGTPAYFVNGRAISGAIGELEFRIILQEELERAEAKLAEGVPKAQLYDVLTTSE